MFQGSPECQLSIINLLIPVVLKVKSKICGSMDCQLSRREDRGGLERIGEAGGGLEWREQRSHQRFTSLKSNVQKEL